MGEIEKLASQISTTSLQERQISQAIRALGFKSSIRGLKIALSISSELAPHFNQLSKLIHSTPHVFQDFLLSSAVLKALNDSGISEDFSVDTSKYPGATTFCTSLLKAGISPESYKQSTVAEPLAFTWYLYSTLSEIPVQNCSQPLARLLSTLQKNLPQLIAYEIEDGLPNLSQLKSYSQFESINEYIGHFSSFLRNLLSPLSPLSDDEIRSSLCDVFGEITKASIQSPIVVTAKNDSQNEEFHNIFITAQRGISLKERERLSIHPNAFSSTELDALPLLIRSVIEGGSQAQTKESSNNHYKPNEGIFPPGYVEAFLVGLAISTGRTIQATLGLRVTVGGNIPLDSTQEQISVAYIKSIGLVAVWLRPMNNGKTLKLVLPSFLSEPLSCFVISNALTLSEGLPYTTRNWDERCYKWLDGKISGSPYGVERKIRDALSRAIYQTSASPSLLSHITTPIDKKESFESLSRYIDPFSERTHKVYEDACIKLFKKYGSQKSRAFSQHLRNSFALTPEQQKTISKNFSDKIESASKSGDLIAFHNAFSNYCLMLLVVATGHRKSTTPFYFPWDILIQERMAFICDKALVGSEARYVPLPNWVTEQITIYRRHLAHLSDHLRYTHPDLAKQIGSYAYGTDFQSSDQTDQTSPNIFGMFFTLDSKNKASTITTSRLQNYYKPAQVASITTFRKSIADHLWNSGCSGLQVEAFLGHNGPMHVFGNSSSWSILEWANTLRPAQEAYLKLSGWKLIPASTLPSNFAKLSLSTSSPNLQASTSSYEGRFRSKNNDRSLVRDLIRENLPDEWFQDDKSSITNEDLELLKNQLKDQLANNPNAAKQINLELAKTINELRSQIGKVDSPITNMTRTEAGPIDITSARQIAIANRLRSWLINRIGSNNRADNDESSAPQAIAEIGICLIIFDGVLNTALLNSLMEAVISRGYESNNGCIQIRTEYKKKSLIAEKNITLTTHTAALIVGFHKCYARSKLGAISPEIVSKSMDMLLNLASIELSISKLNVSALIGAFRSWWQLRLPGSLLAIASGKYLGSALDRHSEAAMFGVKVPPLPDSLHSQTDQANTTRKSLGPHEANIEIHALLYNARGRFDNFESNTRQQRSRLSDELTINLSDSLKDLATSRQIVMLMIGFIKFLLENGGPKKSIYAFGSIPTRYSSIRKLIDIFWDEDLNQYSSDDFDKAYSKLIEETKDKQVDVKTPLILFHKFLQGEIGAPHSRIAANIQRIVTRARTAIVTTSQIDVAWKLISDIAINDTQLQLSSRTAMTLGFDYGQRYREIFGSHSSHFVLSTPIGAFVKRNSARDLKSLASRRFIPCTSNNAIRQKHLSNALKSIALAPGGAGYIFIDPVNRQQLYPTSKVNKAVVSALRKATSNPSIVLHSTRHSFATRLAHGAFISPRSIPISHEINLSLGIDSQNNSLFDGFDAGFNAWPFWVDRAGMILGHSSSDTLLDTYWHTSSYKMAEYTWSEIESDRISDTQISNMLHQDRSTLSKKRSKLLEQNDGNPALSNPYEITVAHYVSKSGIPALGSSLLPDKRGKQKSRRKTKEAESSPFRWMDLDRALCQRMRQNMKLSDLEETITNLGIAPRDAQQLIRTYSSIVASTGFDDFEPKGLNSISARPSRFKGAERGLAERGAGISICQGLAEKSPEFSRKLKQVLHNWIQNVDFKCPWFSANDLEELQVVLGLLRSIGVESKQIRLGLFNVSPEALNNQILSQVSEVKSYETRFSRHAKYIRTPEFGVNVVQLKGSKVGDGRDMHRLFFVLAIILFSMYEKSSAI